MMSSSHSLLGQTEATWCPQHGLLLRIHSSVGERWGLPLAVQKVGIILMAASSFNCMNVAKVENLRG